MRSLPHRRSSNDRRLWRSTVALIALSSVALVSCSGDSSRKNPSPSSDPSASNRGSSTDDTAETGSSEASGSADASALIASDEPLPKDPQVRIGHLPNGLTYYVRENDSPGGSAELRLVVNAGSAMEAPDQQGVAHFLEHMLFNGTEEFPKNELIAKLESLGARFGPDINAYTSYDETVYTLTVPTDADTFVSTAFEVMAQWASQATLAQPDVEAERGVVVGEWRDREEGAEGRVAQQAEQQLLAGTAYERHAPIGTLDSISRMDAERVRRFYEDWYRPDLMAFVAVGDFRAADFESRIKRSFGDLPAPDGRAPSRPTITFTPPREARAAVHIEPDDPSTYADVVYPIPSDAAKTEREVFAQSQREIAFSLLADRLSDDAQRGKTPFYDALFTNNGTARAIDAPGFEIQAEPDRLLDSIDRVLIEVARAAQHGFTPAEIERAVKSRRRSAQEDFDRRSSEQDTAYADEYVQHFLTGEPIASARAIYDLSNRVLDATTEDRVHEAFKDVIASSASTVLAVAPDEARAQVPSVDAILALVGRAATARVDARPNDPPPARTLMNAPAPVAAKTVDIKELEGGTELQFPNGVRVRYLPTEIAANSVTMIASSHGGLSLVAEGDVASARAALDVVPSSGLGALDAVEVERAINDRVVEVSPYLEEAREGFSGSASTDDLETMFQIVHLLMTDPHADPTTLATWKRATRPTALDPSSTPQPAIDREVAAARFGSSAHFQSIPTVEEVDRLTTDHVEQVFKQRFGDAGDFVFSFVGDFKPQKIKDLSRRYLGTLPATRRVERASDRAPSLPPGIITRTISAGTGNQASVNLRFEAPAQDSLRNRVLDQLVSAVLDIRLTRHIREELSATYSPSAYVFTEDDPRAVATAIISITGDATGLDAIERAVLDDLRDLTTIGPNEDEFLAASKQLEIDYGYESNEQWAYRLVFYAERPERELRDEFGYVDALQDIGREDVLDHARATFPLDRYIKVTQLPKSSG